MEMRSYYANGDLLAVDTITHITPDTVRPEGWYNCHLEGTNKIATFDTAYLDRNHPGWRDLLAED